MDVGRALDEVAGHGLPLTLVTGGEPMLQEDVIPLLEGLVAAGGRVVLETSGTTGALPLAGVPEGVRRVVDVKLPGSGIEASQIDWDGMRGLGHDDELKFVCRDRADYEQARHWLAEDGRLPVHPTRLICAVHGLLDAADLARWIVEDRLDVRLQVQLHKVIWPGEDRGV